MPRLYVLVPFALATRWEAWDCVVGGGEAFDHSERERMGERELRKERKKAPPLVSRPWC